MCDRNFMIVYEMLLYYINNIAVTYRKCTGQNSQIARGSLIIHSGGGRMESPAACCGSTAAAGCSRLCCRRQQRPAADSMHQGKTVSTL